MNQSTEIPFIETMNYVLVSLNMLKISQQRETTLTIISITTQSSDSALMIAAGEGKTKVASLLLEAGADHDLQNVLVRRYLTRVKLYFSHVCHHAEWRLSTNGGCQVA